jgi:NAD(P)-dependent dehydrogenase (short-subunit alcohol dehydrogenase family)
MREQRTIVITGVSRGLGRALVDEFVGRGHRLAGCCRSTQAVDDLRRQYGSPHRFKLVDVTDHEAVGGWAEELCADFGPPDLLINNAAIMNRNSPLWEVPTDDFHALMDVNVNGVFHVIRAFLPAMIDRGSGVVVNVSSTWGRSTSADVAPYCASKWAIEGLSQALADDLPGGMASVAFNPGVIHTEMLESCFGSHAAAYPDPRQWVQSAAPFLLGLTAEDNGRSVTAP